MIWSMVCSVLCRNLRCSQCNRLWHLHMRGAALGNESIAPLPAEAVTTASILSALAAALVVGQGAEPYTK